MSQGWFTKEKWKRVSKITFAMKYLNKPSLKGGFCRKKLKNRSVSMKACDMKKIQTKQTSFGVEN